MHIWNNSNNINNDDKIKVHCMVELKQLNFVKIRFRKFAKISFTTYIASCKFVYNVDKIEFICSISTVYLVYGKTIETCLSYG